jgi:hypothetical protein
LPLVQPGMRLNRFTERAIWVATQSPMLPRRISGKHTIPLPRSGWSR